MAAFTAAAIALAGAGLTAYGTMQARSAARDQNAAQTRIIQQEKKAEALRMRAMELDARRKNMEILRQQQRARSLALATSTAQNAAQGSGLQGGYGQISGQTGVNQLGVNQNLYMGREMFGINSSISNARIGYANASSAMASAQAWQQLGGTLFSVGPSLTSLSGGFGGRPGAGTYQGYGTFVSGLGRGGIY